MKAKQWVMPETAWPPVFGKENEGIQLFLPFPKEEFFYDKVVVSWQD